MKLSDIKPGVRCRHFKGGRYEVLARARHTESMEEMVVYRSLEDPAKVWARPLAMFVDEVERDGQTMARFECRDYQ